MRKFNNSIHILFFYTTVAFAASGASETAEPPLFRFSMRTEAINENSARIELNCILTFNDPGAKIHIQLKDPKGRLAYEDSIEDFIIDNWIQQAEVTIPIENPRYWNAEQPNLYQLHLEVKRSDGEPIVEQHPIGLVEYAVNKNDLTCNQIPIHILGVQYTAAHPNRSLPFTADGYREDLLLMQQLNFNSVRATGGAPDAKFIQQCDEMGMYVLIDVGKTYAASTIQAYQNHPSVFAWNLDSSLYNGDELAGAIQQIKRLDPSRPVFVQSSSIEDADERGDGATVSDPPRNHWRLLGVANRPTLAVDLLPAMGRSFEGASYFAALTRAGASLRGGFFQQFADLKTSHDPGPVTSSLLNDRAAQRQWAFGYDGIVNADRSPQPDFWQARRVFSAIEIEEREALFRPGRSIELTLNNWHAFTNMSEYGMQWFLLQDGAVIEHGETQVNLAPQRSMKLAVRPQRAAPDPDANSYLTMQFLRGGAIAHEHTVWLKPKSFETDFIERLRDMKWDETWLVTTSIEESLIEHHDFIFHTRTEDCGWFLLAREGNMRLITAGPFLHLNRELTPPERLQALQSGAGPPCGDGASPLRVISRQVDRRGPDIEIKTRVGSEAADCTTEVEAQIDLLSSPFGYCDVRFLFQRVQSSQTITEAGLSFIVPKTLDHIGWLGDGPHPSYPGMERLSFPGFFNLAPIESIAPGNRRRIQALVLANDSGFGLGLLLWNGDAAWKQTPDGTEIRINAAVAGVGSGGDLTRFSISPEELTQRKHPTVFRLVPIVPGKTPRLFAPWFDK